MPALFRGEGVAGSLANGSVAIANPSTQYLYVAPQQLESGRRYGFKLAVRRGGGSEVPTLIRS